MVNQGLRRWTTKSKSVVTRHTSSIGAGSNDGKSSRLMALLRVRSATREAPSYQRPLDTAIIILTMTVSSSRRSEELRHRPGQALEGQVREHRARRQDDHLFLALDRPSDCDCHALWSQIGHQPQ